MSESIPKKTITVMVLDEDPQNPYIGALIRTTLQDQGVELVLADPAAERGVEFTTQAPEDESTWPAVKVLNLPASMPAAHLAEALTGLPSAEAYRAFGIKDPVEEARRRLQEDIEIQNERQRVQEDFQREQEESQAEAVVAKLSFPQQVLTRLKERYRNFIDEMVGVPDGQAVRAAIDAAMTGVARVHEINVVRHWDVMTTKSKVSWIVFNRVLWFGKAAERLVDVATNVYRIGVPDFMLAQPGAMFKVVMTFDSNDSSETATAEASMAQEEPTGPGAEEAPLVNIKVNGRDFKIHERPINIATFRKLLALNVADRLQRTVAPVENRKVWVDMNYSHTDEFTPHEGDEYKTVVGYGVFVDDEARTANQVPTCFVQVNGVSAQLPARPTPVAEFRRLTGIGINDVIQIWVPGAGGNAPHPGWTDIGQTNSITPKEGDQYRGRPING